MKSKEIQNRIFNNKVLRTSQNLKIEFISITPSSDIEINEKNKIENSCCESI